MSAEQPNTQPKNEEQPGIIILDEPYTEQLSFPRPLYLDSAKAFTRDRRPFAERHPRIASLASAVGDAVLQLSDITGRGYRRR